jgi:rubrerythrin
MNKEDNVKLVSYCNICGTTIITTNTAGTCPLCEGQLYEIGWVEETNG